MLRPLGMVAVVLAVALLAYYGWEFLSRPHIESPKELAQTALNADTAATRELAAVGLSQFGQPAREQLVSVFGASKQPEVRAACVHGLAQQWDYDSMPLLLDALDDEALSVREQAGQAVQRMLRINYEFCAGDPPEKRQAVVKRLRTRWGIFRNSEVNREFIRQYQGK